MGYGRPTQCLAWGRCPINTATNWSYGLKPAIFIHSWFLGKAKRVTSTTHSHGCVWPLSSLPLFLLGSKNSDSSGVCGGDMLSLAGCRHPDLGTSSQSKSPSSRDGTRAPTFSAHLRCAARPHEDPQELRQGGASTLCLLASSSGEEKRRDLLVFPVANGGLHTEKTRRAQVTVKKTDSQ